MNKWLMIVIAVVVVVAVFYFASSDIAFSPRSKNSKAQTISLLDAMAKGEAVDDSIIIAKFEKGYDVETNLASLQLGRAVNDIEIRGKFTERG